jgi:hypothetical protein
MMRAHWQPTPLCSPQFESVNSRIAPAIPIDRRLLMSVMGGKRTPARSREAR